MSTDSKWWQGLPRIAKYAFTLMAIWALGIAVPLLAAAQNASNDNLEKVTLHLKWMHGFQAAGFHAAQAQGYYQEEGLAVTIKPAAPGDGALAAVMNGDAEYGVWSCEVLNERLVGKPIVVLAAIFQHSPYIILSRKDSNIRVPSDLIGHTVMNAPGMEKALLEGMMIHEGLSPGSITIVPHSWCIDDLINGKVDASMDYITNEPNQMQMRGVEPAIIQPRDYGIDFYGDCLFTTEAEIEKHPERVAAFRRASLKGWKYAMSHVDELIKLILTLPGVEERGLTTEHLRYEAEQMQKLILPKLVEIGHMNAGRWQHIADTYVNLGMLEPNYSLDGFIYEPNPRRDLRWLYALFGSLVGIMIVAVMAWFWNRQLRTAVGLRTRELAKSEGKVHAMLNATTEIVMLLDPDGNVVTANLSAARRFGLTPEELTGKCPFDLLPPEVAASRRKIFHELMANKKPIRFEDRNGDCHFDNSVFPILDGDGDVRLFAVFAQDITEHKRAEEESRNSKELLRSVLDMLPAYICAKDLQGKFILVNRTLTDFYGTTVDEMTGKLHADLCEDENELQAMLVVDREVVASGKPKMIPEETMKRPDGSISILQTHKIPFFTHDRPAVLIAALDITERKRTEEENVQLLERLAESRRLEGIGQLAGGVAHDFNNQLAGIIGYAELLLRQDDEKTNRYAGMILKTARRSADLTTQLLAFSRKAELQITNVDVHALIAEVVSLLGHTVDRRITITQCLEAVPATTLGDASQLQNALLNLAINGCDVMLEGGELTLKTTLADLDEAFCQSQSSEVVPGQFIQISVSDTGTGMDEETLSHVFEPFFTTKDIGAGTGLGLAAVQGTVKSHGGIVDVQSEPGKGSTFNIFLPLAMHKDDTTDNDAEFAQLCSSGTARILFVDDEEAVRGSAGEMLRELGYEVVPCEHGAAAVDYYRESWRDVDLVILDMMMPKMNGHDTFLAMREINPKVKVLLLSGFSLDSRIQAVLDQGASGYLQKPFRLAELSDKVAKILGSNDSESEEAGRKPVCLST